MRTGTSVLLIRLCSVIGSVMDRIVFFQFHMLKPYPSEMTELGDRGLVLAPGYYNKMAPTAGWLIDNRNLFLSSGCQRGWVWMSLVRAADRGLLVVSSHGTERDCLVSSYDPPQ